MEPIAKKISLTDDQPISMVSTDLTSECAVQHSTVAEFYWTAIVLPFRRLVKHFMPRAPREKADRMASIVPLWPT